MRIQRYGLASSRALAVLIGVAFAHLSDAHAQPQVADAPSVFNTGIAVVESSALPPVPRGKSTILGGDIQNIDPIRDQLTLKVPAQRPMKILFDERTQVYLDGKRIPLLELHSGDHASVQTVLDGTGIFALSIHKLSGSPEFECRGFVENYNPGTGELSVSSTAFPEPLKLQVPASASVIREGQPAFSSVPSGLEDLVEGSLVSIKFESNKEGRRIASKIVVLAIPGSSFVFIGNISFLDMHAGSMVLVDPRDEKSYRIFFSSDRLPTGQNLREGDRVRVTASFDGGRYVAGAITID